MALARLGGAAAEYCGFIGAARDGERGVAENVAREATREVVGLAARDDVGLEGAGLEDEFRAADGGGNEAVLVMVLDGLAQIRAADDFVHHRDFFGVNEDVGCALDYGGRVLSRRDWGIVPYVFGNVAAADDALADRDRAFTRHDDGGVAFNDGLAAVGDIIAADENAFLTESDGLVLGRIDLNGGGLCRGGSAFTSDAATGHDMAVVRAAVDLQGGVARHELEFHALRVGMRIVFSEAAAVDGTAEGAAVDGDGGVADGGVRLGDPAGSVIRRLDVVAAYHGALGRGNAQLNDAVLNDERRVAVGDGALACIVRLAARDNVFGLHVLDGHLGVADGGRVLLIKCIARLEIVAADDFINLRIIGQGDGQVARVPCMIEVGLSGDLTHIMPPAADDLCR